MNRRHVGIGLLVVGLLLVVTGFIVSHDEMVKYGVAMGVFGIFAGSRWVDEQPEYGPVEVEEDACCDQEDEARQPWV